ncbi:MAG TPA: peptidoglycan-binding protein [Candidatus Omnitrophota bacterium]|nr:peptidoglycan-binding protein [Candidatus Omnitrophota bacterium]
MPLAKLRLALAFPLLCLLPLPVLAGYAEGVAAYGRGAHDVAAAEFRAAAEAGDVESAYMLARLYALGSGVPQDWAQAWAWHDRAARQGHEEARDARDSLASIMTPAQMAQARSLAAPPPAVAAPALRDSRQQVVIIPRESVPAGPPVRLSAPIATYEGLAGSTGSLEDQTRLVQRELNRRGYFAGAVDGRLGPQTRQAIRAYQADAGIAADGRMTADLVDRLAGAATQQAELR